MFGCGRGSSGGSHFHKQVKFVEAASKFTQIFYFGEGFCAFSGRIHVRNEWE